MFANQFSFVFARGYASALRHLLNFLAWFGHDVLAYPIIMSFIVVFGHKGRRTDKLMLGFVCVSFTWCSAFLRQCVMFCCVVSILCVVFSWSFFVVCPVFVTERCSAWAVVTCINTVTKVLVFDID